MQLVFVGERHCAPRRLFAVPAGIGICLILAVLATGVLGHTVDNASIFLAVVESGMQQVIIFTLVVTLTSFKVVACLMACLTFAVTVLWKRLLLGSLSPGTCVVSSRCALGNRYIVVLCMCGSSMGLLFAFGTSTSASRTENLQQPGLQDYCG